MAIQHTQVVVVGGGLAGLTQAAALAGGAVDVVIVDRESRAAHADETYDGRTTAVALGTRRILEAAGVWERVADEASPILDIRITDADRPVFLHFDHQEVGDEPFGHIVDNRLLRVRQFELLDELPTVRHLAPAAVTALERDAGGVTVRLDNGDALRAQLVIGADGRHSFVRKSADIGVFGWQYNQTAIVTAMAHEMPHDGVALEHFRAHGPFAVLPLNDAEDGTHRSSVVWSERRDLVGRYMALSDEAFGAELQARVGDWLGQVRPLGRRFAYPLGVQLAKRYIADRVALIGEAAHVMHPIAGQGLNVGLRDAAAIAELAIEASRLGMDVGEWPLLQRFERMRRADNLMMIAATDGLLRLFSNAVPPVRWAREFGLTAVGQLPPLKKFFMRHAMGTGGLVPRFGR